MNAGIQQARVVRTIVGPVPTHQLQLRERHGDRVIDSFVCRSGMIHMASLAKPGTGLKEEQVDAPWVLIVEGDPSVREIVAELLRDEGYWVAQAASGAVPDGLPQRGSLKIRSRD